MARTVVYGEGRDLLISATVDIVAERGLRGLTFRALADHVGVNNSLIAHHFGTREALLRATLDRVLDSSIDLTGHLDLSSAEAFADTLLSSIAARPELQAFQYEMILEARRNPAFREPVDALYDRYQDLVARNLRERGVSGDLDAMARSVSATMDGIVLQYLVGIDPARLREALAHLWRTGIRPLLP